MSFLELLLVGIGLSMDACAVAICQGLCMPKLNLRHAGVIGLFFGGFQGLMPFIGYILGTSFASYITNIAPWIAFILLSSIGANMIKESLGKEDEETSESFDAKTMFLMAVATSIDALAVGITFACVPVKLIAASALINTLIAVVIIGVVTFALSCIGVKIGNVFGSKYKSKAEFAGGAILILLGLKILLEHFEII